MKYPRSKDWLDNQRGLLYDTRGIVRYAGGVFPVDAGRIFPPPERGNPNSRVDGRAGIGKGVTMELLEKRKAKRYVYRASISYELQLPDGSYDAPVAAAGLNVGAAGISFSSRQALPLHALVRISLLVNSRETVSCRGRVVRSMADSDQQALYHIGVALDGADEVNQKRMEIFFKNLDINNILDGINLDHVVDVNLIAGFPPVIKRLKKLVILKGDPFDELVLRNMLLSILDTTQYEKFMQNKECNCIFTTRQGTRFRVNLHFQQNKIEGTLRFIPARISAPSELGLPKTAEHLLMERNGLIMVAGSTGSGKTTTLASMVEFLNNLRTGIIICIEDPIEYLHANRLCIIKQRELGRDTLSFYNAARNALRQNPDVLVVGEILDRETMETAITAAETGALVMTSIHAGDVAQTLDRVSSFFSPDVQPYILKRLSLVLRGVIAQELIPRLDEEGMALAAEVLTVTSAVRRAIREADWKQIPSFIQVGKNAGMQTMQQSLRDLVNKNIISSEYLLDEFAG
ncbi:MAG: PilT/PilU family type 4a pilus ATPase [Candidatus Omnitrophica bacterium]|nr:PilT/PilU family type 4a pilus ATPase [Candidatus Omnitrophota bacterium]